MAQRVSGVKRRKSAIEGTFRYFQTIQLLITHLKRESDRKKIFELLDKRPTLKSILMATASVHLYHSRGMRVLNAVESGQFSDNTAQTIELEEKRILMREIELLLKNSLDLEIDLFQKITLIENSFLSLLIEMREKRLGDLQTEKKIEDIKDKIELELLDIITRYPQYYFYDFIGDLIGLTNDLKYDILAESSGFKDISIDLEKRLEIEEKEDITLELSALNRMIEQLQKEFEFKSHKELQVQTMPVRMIKKRILDHEFDRYPVSVFGLKMFLKGNLLKEEIIGKMKTALTETIDYEQFEGNIKDFIKSELISNMKNDPNDFLYFLQVFDESSFEEIIYMMNKQGVFNIVQLRGFDDNSIEQLKKNLIRYNIKKQDFLVLSDLKKSLIYQFARAMCELKDFNIQEFSDNEYKAEESGLIQMLNQENPKIYDLWKKVEHKVNFTLVELREFSRKKQVIDKVFFNELNFTSYNQILMLLNFEQIIDSVVTDIYFNLLSKIIRQLARIIESYMQIGHDKALFLQALEKVSTSTRNEDWAKIKIEELIIKRIVKRQQESVVILDAKNQIFLVNGLILSRLTERSLEESISTLRDEPSQIYDDIHPLKLKADLGSPISYCIAYDIHKRLEKTDNMRRQQVLERKITEEVEEEVKRKEIQEKQKQSTLNWIERRITSSLMRVRSGINPTHLYWQDRDTKILTDNIKLHGELGGEVFERFYEFFIFSVEKIRQFVPKFKLPDESKIKNMLLNVSEDVLSKRIGPSINKKHLNNILDGERYEISKQLAIKIGKLLDKALYFKFRKM